MMRKYVCVCVCPTVLHELANWPLWDSLVSVAEYAVDKCCTHSSHAHLQLASLVPKHGCKCKSTLWIYPSKVNSTLMADLFLGLGRLISAIKTFLVISFNFLSLAAWLLQAVRPFPAGQRQDLASFFFFLQRRQWDREVVLEGKVFHNLHTVMCEIMLLWCSECMRKEEKHKRRQKNECSDMTWHWIRRNHNRDSLQH